MHPPLILYTVVDLLPTPQFHCFSLVGGNNSPDDLIGDILNSTDSSNLLGGFGLNSTAPPQSQQTQGHPMINLSTSLPSLQPTAVGLGSSRMASHGVTYPQVTVHSTGGSSPSHSGGRGGRGQYEMIAGGQYLNQLQMVGPGGMKMAMGQQHALHPHQRVPHASMSPHQIVQTPQLTRMPLLPQGGIAGNVMGGVFGHSSNSVPQNHHNKHFSYLRPPTPNRPSYP